MATRMEKKIEKMEKQLIEKYGLKKAKAYCNKYKKALEYVKVGDMVAELKGTEFAQREFFDIAEKMKSEIPQDIIEYWDLAEEELW